jgi:hypothetical protein
MLESGENKVLSAYTLLNNKADYVLSINSGTTPNTTLSESDGRRIIYCDTTDRDCNIELFESKSSNAGDEVEIYNTTNGGKVNITCNGTQTINGLTYVYLYSQYNKVILKSTGSGWIIKKIKSYFWAGGINRTIWNDQDIGTVKITITAGNAFEVGELITESGSGYTWRIMFIDGNDLHCRVISGAGYATNGQTLTGDYSGITDTVNGDTINQTANIYHGAGIVSRKVYLEFWLSSDGAEGNYFRMMMKESNRANVFGYTYFATNTNECALHSGDEGFDYINKTGGSEILENGDSFYYNILVNPYRDFE